MINGQSYMPQVQEDSDNLVSEHDGALQHFHNNICEFSDTELRTNMMLVAKNAGTVTLNHFSRVLSFVGLRIASEEFLLLLKKFLKSGYTVNYIAFVNAIENIILDLEKHGELEALGDMLSQYPGRYLSAEMPKLPRPELGKVSYPAQGIRGGRQHSVRLIGCSVAVTSSSSVMLSLRSGRRRALPAAALVTPGVVTSRSICRRCAGPGLVLLTSYRLATHTALTTYPPDESADQLVRRLQHHVLSEGIRTREVFTDKDPHKTGRVTREQFRCALDMLGVAGTQRLFMSETEIHSLADAYKDPDNESYICWDRFVNDIDKVHGLEKFPCLRVEVPPNGVRDVPRRGAVQPGTPLPKLCQDALDNIKIQLKELSCQLRPGFSNYDKRRCGHVSPEQFRQALQVAGLDVPGDQQTCLLQYFSDDMGFNYQSFLQAVEPLDNPPLYEKYLEQVKRINAPRPGRKPSSQETNIVEIMAKMKSKVVKNRMRIIEFLRNFDRHNQQCISKANFARGLDPLGLQLTPTEVETLAEVFASPKQPGFVEYLRLVEAVEEAVTQAGLQRAPTITPIQHLAINDGDHNFLNFEERQMVIRVLERLARHNEYNFISAFKTAALNQIMVLTGEITSENNEITEEDIMSENYEIAAELWQQIMGQDENSTWLSFTAYVEYDKGVAICQSRTTGKVLQEQMTEKQEIEDTDETAPLPDWDPTNIGTISKEQLFKVFSVLGIASSFSGQEIDILTKCFGVERGLRLEVDYRALCHVLDILHNTSRAHAA
ncbi:uncharacterized protein LOC126202244 [Schistocerca nitens]|uniref:uncharacterized protein LOC126202244 n=1 Tax=Schistocerca nitens TaxID=7011 RepID=UPI0021191CBA|nr:uncharacterized protein LOC126202244 [Schistocerca nitens]